MNIQKYGKKIVNRHLPSWKFGYHKHTKKLARTSHRHKKITLNKKLSKEENIYFIRNLIRHEIAHAKSNRSGHGKTWQREAKKIKVAKWARKKKINIVKSNNEYYIKT